MCINVTWMLSDIIRFCLGTFKDTSCECVLFFSSETTWNNFQSTLTNRNKQKQRSFKQRCWQSVFEVMHFESVLSQICSLPLRKLVLVGSFPLQGKGLKFLWHLSAAGIKRGNSRISRGSPCFVPLHCDWISKNADTNLYFEVALIFGCGALMFQECAFDVDILD